MSGFYSSLRFRNNAATIVVLTLSAHLLCFTPQSTMALPTTKVHRSGPGRIINGLEYVKEKQNAGLVSQKNDEQMSEEQVERELNDPTKDWNRVSSDPDFLLMNGDDQALRMRRRQEEKLSSMALLNDLLLADRPVYDLDMDQAMRKKRGKLMRLSVTDNIDVLREKLFMEIARRNRLLNQNQASMANTELDLIG